MSEKALSLYKHGLEEKDTLLRTQAFNASIQLLLDSKEENNVLMAANLAQLREYPLALYYYMEELKKDPKNADLRQSINETIKRGNLNTKVPDYTAFGPSSWILGLAFLLWFVVFSLWLKMRKRGVLLFSFVLLLNFLTLIVFSYRSLIPAVILHAQTLYQSSNGKEVVSRVPAGKIVEVLDVQKHGAWIKIRTEDGVMGYVPQGAVRIVE